MPVSLPLLLLAAQVDTPAKKLLLGVALAYIGLVVILPFVNVFIQVRGSSRSEYHFSNTLMTEVAGS